MVEKISLLVFSRNDIDKALALIDDMYDCVDEIVLVDSSNGKKHKRLLKEKKERRLEKLRVFYAIAFGYPDPLRMYAINKCSCKWVMLIDTDERVSPKFKMELQSILEKARCSAFALKRYEDVTREGRGPYYNWQIRLFMKDRTEYRGMLHEEPIINGKVMRLADPDYYIDHLAEIKGKSIWYYLKMMQFQRMSYATFNETMVEYFYKYTVPDYRTDKTVSAGWIYRILTGYEILTRRKPEEELSNFDYFIYYFTYSLAIGIRTGRPITVLKALPFGIGSLKNVREWKSDPDSKRIFEISKILHRMGLIKFLDLDKDATIAYLNKRYKGKKQGAELLIRLLKERYERDYGAEG